ncbi:uncharacterized protein MONBRDRAFT_8597 [Monosiga brevicollis MX1]|uniref:Protein kinase domain-containing protein n=1 Tax=Monosiga brevicollis TaxID=81824 RepID=A9V0I8_MONBE|nr:uncharacterized protein MONBRDRAFT_8597 [Monosiga brevicollis MX1]EDQ89023.1 predicted protein [Monosiga brevicollis MX1]|eukprot:XP_001746128.1 hypothetical protein [Monosiga brevicollis MX1]
MVRHLAACHGHEVVVGSASCGIHPAPQGGTSPCSAAPCPKGKRAQTSNQRAIDAPCRPSDNCGPAGTLFPGPAQEREYVCARRAQAPRRPSRRLLASDCSTELCRSVRRLQTVMTQSPVALQRHSEMPAALHGFIYGPIRINVLPLAVFDQLQAAGYNVTIVLHHRHPLDQIVSEFWSFGYTHPPPNARTRTAEQLQLVNTPTTAPSVPAPFASTAVSCRTYLDARCCPLLAIPQAATVFVFDRKALNHDKSVSKADREAILAVLRRGALQLGKLHHPYVVKVCMPLQETKDWLAFATEPLLASLAHALRPTLPQVHDLLPYALPCVCCPFPVDRKTGCSVIPICSLRPFPHSSLRLDLMRQDGQPAVLPADLSTVELDMGFVQLMPGLALESRDKVMAPFVLPSIFAVAQLVTPEEYEEELWPAIEPLLHIHDPIQVRTCCKRLVRHLSAAKDMLIGVPRSSGWATLQSLGELPNFAHVIGYDALKSEILPRIELGKMFKLVRGMLDVVQAARLEEAHRVETLSSLTAEAGTAGAGAAGAAAKSVSQSGDHDFLAQLSQASSAHSSESSVSKPAAVANGAEKGRSAGDVDLLGWTSAASASAPTFSSVPGQNPFGSDPAGSSVMDRNGTTSAAHGANDWAFGSNPAPAASASGPIPQMQNPFASTATSTLSNDFDLLGFGSSGPAAPSSTAAPALDTGTDVFFSGLGASTASSYVPPTVPTSSFGASSTAAPSKSKVDLSEFDVFA